MTFCFFDSYTVSQQYVCRSKKLQSLIMDGLTSQCSSKIWSFYPGSPSETKRVPGPIPDCIWTDLKNLTTFHASGNLELHR